MTSAGEPSPSEAPTSAVVKHPLLIMAVSAAATLALLLSLALIWGLATYSLPGPASANGSDRIVELSQGANLSEISEVLAQDKVISSAPVFVMAAKLTGSARRLKAGEYSFASKASMATVMEMIRKGKRVRHQVTIPEGFASDMVVDALMKSDVLTGTVSAPPEGSVMPQTYEVKRGETRAAVLERMMKAQTDLVAELWPKRRRGLPFTTPEQAVTLASIVEKETAKADERPRIAALFINRLQQGMRLESDPTIIYGITRGRPLGRGLRASEVDAATPYNTYVIFGLPPTPIANPGRAALEAVLTAPSSSEIFFVADGTGGHVFATSYDDHRRNVAQWRRIERQQAATPVGGR
jgi:UPF0755 protein